MRGWVEHPRKGSPGMHDVRIDVIPLQGPEVLEQSNVPRGREP